MSNSGDTMNREEMKALASHLANELAGLAFILNDPLATAHKENLRKWIAALRASAAPEEGMREIAAKNWHGYLRGFIGRADTDAFDQHELSMIADFIERFAALSPDSRKAEPVAWRLVCSNKPRPSVHKTGKGHQHWKRDAHHIAGDDKITLCKINASEWLDIRAFEPQDVDDTNLCGRCKAASLAALVPATEDGGRELAVRAIQLSYARKDLEPTSETTLALYREDAEHAADAVLRALSPSPSVGTPEMTSAQSNSGAK